MANGTAAHRRTKLSYRPTIMNLHHVYDFIARHLLTQNAQCLTLTGNCTCQRGTLRCAAASLAIESDVNLWYAPNCIPSLVYFEDHDEFLSGLINIHDKHMPDLWESKLHDFAIRHGFQPFSISDLQSGRGKQNPVALWYTDPEKRERLLKVHAAAGTINLLTDYLKEFPLNVG